MKRARSIRLQPKLLLGLLAMAAVLAAILAPSIAQLYRARMEEQYASLAFGQASVAADLIDGDRVEQYYRTGEKDAYYEEIHRYLQDVREKLGLKYFYVVVPEDEVMYYIWDAGVPGEDGVCDLGDTDAYYGGGNELMHGAFAVDAEQTILITNNEEYGYLASAYVAILNKAGTPVALASVDISMDMIDQQIRQFLGLTLCVVLARSAAFHFRVLLLCAAHSDPSAEDSAPRRHRAGGEQDGGSFSLPGGGQHRRRAGGACPFVPVHGVGAE